MAERCASDHGVSPMVNRERTPPPESSAGERSDTSATMTGSSPTMPASSPSAVDACARVPWTPAGPSGYGATCVTMNMFDRAMTRS